MGSISPTTCAILSVTLFAAIYRILQIGRREKHLPPGPPTKPILGNLDIIPSEEAYVKFTEWANEYGGVFSLKIASKTVIVVSSYDAMYEIMERNGSITAGRPNRAHLIRIFGEEGTMTQLQYGPRFRTLRRVANEMFKPSACERHAPIQLAETNQLMVDFLDQPENFFDGIKRFSVSMSLAVSFGVRAPVLHSSQSQRVLQAYEGIHKIGAPGQVPPIDLLPILYYLPDRFANNWKARCDELHQAFNRLYSECLEISDKRIATGQLNECFAEKLMECAEEYDLDRRTIGNMAGNFLGTSVHTTNSTIQRIVLLATVYGEEQQRMREEIDLVIGPDRLPTLKDIPHLPYLRAFIKEALRFRTVAPLGIPHRATEDQWYNGYLIPKGSNIFVNIWAIFHDPNIFDDPDSFNPDRFMDSSSTKGEMWKKLETLSFGVGRRLCPGMHLANQTVELVTASLIWGFEFNSHAGGKPDPSDFSSNTTCDPRPFKCDIKPRSLSKATLMRQNLASSKSVFEIFGG